MAPCRHGFWVHSETEYHGRNRWKKTVCLAGQRKKSGKDSSFAISVSKDMATMICLPQVGLTSASFQHLPKEFHQMRAKSSTWARRQHFRVNVMHFVDIVLGFCHRGGLGFGLIHMVQLLLHLCRWEEKLHWSISFVSKTLQRWGSSLIFTVEMRCPKMEASRKHGIKLCSFHFPMMSNTEHFCQTQKSLLVIIGRQMVA